jgi:signal transduction histidine kinase
MKLLAEEYLGGKISFESSRENGTTFTLSLPLRPKGF